MKSNKYLILIAIFVIIVLFGWNSYNSRTLKPIIVKSKKVWVFVEIKTITPRDTSDYFYYGQISESVIDRINDNNYANGLFILSNIRYYNDDDLLQLYEDVDSYGYQIFRIEDIQHLKVYKKDPIQIFDINELHESAKKLRLGK